MSALGCGDEGPKALSFKSNQDGGWFESSPASQSMERVMTEYEQESWMYGELDSPKPKKKQLAEYYFSNNCFLGANNPFPMMSSCHPFVVTSNNTSKFGANAEISDLEIKHELKYAARHIEDYKKWTKRYEDMDQAWSKAYREQSHICAFFMGTTVLLFVTMVFAHLL